MAAWPAIITPPDHQGVIWADPLVSHYPATAQECPAGLASGLAASPVSGSAAYPMDGRADRPDLNHSPITVYLASPITRYLTHHTFTQ